MLDFFFYRTVQKASIERTQAVPSSLTVTHIEVLMEKFQDPNEFTKCLELGKVE